MTMDSTEPTNVVMILGPVKAKSRPAIVPAVEKDAIGLAISATVSPWRCSRTSVEIERYRPNSQIGRWMAP